MANAVVLQVKLGDATPEEGLAMLEQVVVPTAKAQPGFQKGIWMRSADNTGFGVVVFDTEDNANAATSNLMPPSGGPELISITVCEVGAEA